MTGRTGVSLLLVLCALGGAAPRASMAAPPRAIVYIGDSHSAGPIGRKLDTLLRTVTPRVSFHGASGSSPYWWVGGFASRSDYYFHEAKGKPRWISGGPSSTVPIPALLKLLDKTCPDVTIIALGANMVPRRNPNGPDPNPWGAFNDRQTRDLVAMLGKSKCAKPSACIWIGPPDSRIFHDASQFGDHFEALYASLRSVTTELGCRFVDLRPFARYPDQGGDGLHWDARLSPQGVAMAEAIAEKAFYALGF